MRDISMPQKRHIRGAVTRVLCTFLFLHTIRKTLADDHPLCRLLGSSNPEVDLGNVLYGSAVGICCSEV